MTIAREILISVETIPNDHVITRCFRRTSHRDEDYLTYMSDEHRLVFIFSISIGVYTTMSSINNLGLSIDAEHAKHIIKGERDVDLLM